MRLSLVIPFHNEEPNVRTVLKEVRAVFPDAEIIAVDDGSTDGTRAAIASVEKVVLLPFDENRGQGFAIYEGFSRAGGDVRPKA